MEVLAAALAAALAEDLEAAQEEGPEDEVATVDGVVTAGEVAHVGEVVTADEDGAVAVVVTAVRDYEAQMARREYGNKLNEAQNSR